MHSIDGHPLPINELKGTKPTESVDLSDKGYDIGFASGIIIAACIKDNPVLKQLKCACQPVLPLLSMSWPSLHFSCTRPIVCGSLNETALCGINKFGYGEFDASGVTALADAIGKHQ